MIISLQLCDFFIFCNKIIDIPKNNNKYNSNIDDI